MNSFPNITTSTEIQRNYKSVAKRARALDDALIVMSNNKPELAIMGFGLYQSLIRLDTTKKKHQKIKKDNDFSEFLGAWTQKEFDVFNNTIEEEFEQIDLKEWK